MFSLNDDYDYFVIDAKQNVNSAEETKVSIAFLLSTMVVLGTAVYILLKRKNILKKAN